MLTLGRWRGMEWQAKVGVQNRGWARLKPKKPVWQGFDGSLIAEMEQNQHCELWTAKKAATPAETIASTRNCHSNLSHHSETTPVIISFK